MQITKETRPKRSRVYLKHSYLSARRNLNYEGSGRTIELRTIHKVARYTSSSTIFLWCIVWLGASGRFRFHDLRFTTRLPATPVTQRRRLLQPLRLRVLDTLGSEYWWSIYVTLKLLCAKREKFSSYRSVRQFQRAYQSSFLFSTNFETNSPVLSLCLLIIFDNIRNYNIK